MSPVAVAVGAASWALAGVAVAVRLRALGHPPGEVLVALPCWPLFVPAALAPAATASAGPYAAAIADAVARLGVALADDPGAAGIDLAPLAAALHRADARVARLDRVIHAEGQAAGRAPAPADDEALAPLLAARAAATAEIAAVLAELRRLRLAAGLRALDAGPGGLAPALGELLARARALDEVATVGAPLRAAP